jgi:hypothetical protein
MSAFASRFSSVVGCSCLLEQLCRKKIEEDRRRYKKVEDNSFAAA